LLSSSNVIPDSTWVAPKLIETSLISRSGI
jgi:hypothetical protein